ncbi:MAG: DUF2358 domain-containing protein [Gloeomargarita sp. DG_2_bins_126]
MDVLAILREDYARFPENQTYDIYAEDISFADPMMRVEGKQKYQEMIRFLATWLQNICLELHEMSQEGQVIYTRWTMSWTAPLPWRPRVRVTGRSELTLNDQGQINRQIDYWDGSRWDLLRQHLPWPVAR